MTQQERNRIDHMTDRQGQQIYRQSHDSQQAWDRGQNWGRTDGRRDGWNDRYAGGRNNGGWDRGNGGSDRGHNYSYGGGDRGNHYGWIAATTTVGTAIARRASSAVMRGTTAASTTARATVR